MPCFWPGESVAFLSCWRRDMRQKRRLFGLIGTMPLPVAFEGPFGAPYTTCRVRGRGAICQCCVLLTRLPACFGPNLTANEDGRKLDLAIATPPLEQAKYAGLL